MRMAPSPRTSPIRSLAVAGADGRTLTLTFNVPTQVLIQDNRRWGPSISLRIGTTATLARAESAAIAFQISTPEHLDLDFDRPVTIERGPAWIPLDVDLDIAPGSALDFSTLIRHDAPAGSLGRVIARADGQFAFAQDEHTPRRFYGVNLCFSAQYITHGDADRLCDRLLRLGYNAVRIHHYEDGLTHGHPGDELDPVALDRLDYLVAGLKKRGIYLTTDLFVSRTVSAAELGLPADQPLNFKVLVPVLPAAFDNWKHFARVLLEHRNPFTGLRYADDPALAWLAMINEGNFENYYGDILRLPAWSAAFASWLHERYADRGALKAAWGIELADTEDPASGSVALPRDCADGSHRSRDLLQFLTHTEQEMFLRMANFLHHDLGCAALLTNTNAWTNRLTGQLTRSGYDYVDDHFYIDHPSFLEHPWQLPSRSGNANPLTQGALGGSSSSFVRLWGKPFTITEYDYCAPGRYRGMGGLLTGSLAALQGWAGIWHFAYSHADRAELEVTRMDYFNLACDPLSQAADRAALCLFLRGDLQPAAHRLAIAMKAYELEEPAAANPRVNPGWDSLAWTTGVGTLVESGNQPGPAFDARFEVHRNGAYDAGGLDPYHASREAVVSALHAAGVLAAGSPDERDGRILRSDTAEITIDSMHGTLVVDTPRTAGGFAEAGLEIHAVHAGVAVSQLSSSATVFVSTLDGQPIATSRHLLVTHLTDVQNSGARFAESARQTLLDWGSLPYLAAAGSARIEIAAAEPGSLTVWALSTAGKRLAEIPTAISAGRLAFSVDVNGPTGARLLYEVAPR
jgi:hypothetical protein